MLNKHQITEERYEGKLSRTVLKTNGVGDNLVEFNNLTKAIEYKLQEAGGFLVKVPTKKVKPSQTCPDCGHQRKKELSERSHVCSECGASCDRDVAAARVMLSWASGTLVLNRGEEISTSSPQHTGGWKQISSMKRQKRTVQR